MKNSKIFLIAALLGTVLASCQKEVDVKEEKPVETKGWSLTVNATMATTTKAMSLSGTELKSYWKADEAVGVYLGSTKLGTLTAGNITNEGANAVLSGELTTIEGLSINSGIILVFPDKNVLTYLGQDGSAPGESTNLATNFDYAIATVAITDINTSTKMVTVGGPADFESLQSIYRLRFKESSTYFNVSSISITSSQNRLVRTMGPVNNLMDSDCGTLTIENTVNSADNYYYMAIRNENTNNDDTYSFTIVRSTDNAVLEGTKPIPADALSAPKYIPVSVSVSQKVMAQAAATNTISADADVL